MLCLENRCSRALPSSGARAFGGGGQPLMRGCAPQPGAWLRKVATACFGIGAASLEKADDGEGPTMLYPGEGGNAELRAEG